MSRPRLISYTSGLWPCGVASYQRNLAAALAEFADVDTIPLPTRRVPGKNLRAILRQRRVYRELAARSARYDAAVIDYTGTFWNGSRLGENFFPAFAAALKAPTVVVLHEGPGRTDPADVPGPWLTRGVYRLAHLGLTARDTGPVPYSSFVRTRLFDFATHLVTHADALAAVAPGRVRVLPTPAYPLSEPAWTPDEVDARFGLADKRVALLLGFPQPSKGFDRAVAALPHLPADVVLVQVGHSERSQPEGLKLLAQAEAVGAAGRFIRTGPLSEAELAAVLLRADCGLAPFRSVRQSSSLGHLIAAELPIVASRIPSTERLAADGAGLRFADCGDPRRLAEAVSQVLTHPGVREGLRVKNAEYANVHGFRSVARFVAGLVATVPEPEPLLAGGVR